jgi:hypothetical protein
MDFEAYLDRLRAWSEQVHGPGPRLRGILAHLREELAEVEGNPADLLEWCDVIALAANGAMRQGFSAAQVAEGLLAKQRINEGRTWADWREFPEDQPINHVR